MAYQGWKNYPTWNIALWLNNDQGLYEMVSEYVDMEEPSKADLADYIEQLFTEPDYGLLPDLPSGPASDIVGWAYEQVDWREVAAGFLED